MYLLVLDLDPLPLGWQLIFQNDIAQHAVLYKLCIPNGVVVEEKRSLIPTRDDPISRRLNVKIIRIHPVVTHRIGDFI